MCVATKCSVSAWIKKHPAVLLAKNKDLDISRWHLAGILRALPDIVRVQTNRCKEQGRQHGPRDFNDTVTVVVIPATVRAVAILHKEVPKHPERQEENRDAHPIDDRKEIVKFLPKRGNVLWEPREHVEDAEETVHESELQ